MSTQLLQIEPNELRFVFELKKQISCSVQLENKADECIAFKVKTTSPRKYCVRSNMGIIKPREKCVVTIIKQAEHTAPLDMMCNDKFLFQSIVVPFGTTFDILEKYSGKYFEEKKLRVVLINPPSSQVMVKQEVAACSRSGGATKVTQTRHGHRWWNRLSCVRKSHVIGYGDYERLSDGEE